MAQHNDLGKWGEQVAADYLTARGYAIIDRNVREGHAEIDIVAQKDGDVAFVEVKTRTSPYIDPVEAIDEKKMKRLARAADAFLCSRKLTFRPRLDIITVVGTPQTDYKVEHLPDAFEPPLTTFN